MLMNCHFECQTADLLNTNLLSISKTFKSEPFPIQNLVKTPSPDTQNLLTYLRVLLSRETPLNHNEELLVRALISYHPEERKRDQASNPCVQVSIGEHMGTKSFLLDNEPVSIKKSLNGLARLRADRVIEKTQERFELQTKKFGSFLVKLYNMYPSCKEQIVNNLIEKMPHRNMPLEAHLLYLKLVFFVLRQCPLEEEKILKAVLKSLCQIDVEIVVPSYKTKVHSSFEQYMRELKGKLLSEREIKLGCLIH